MPFGLIAALGIGVFAIALNEKQKRETPMSNDNYAQRNTTRYSDGSYRDSYGNTYQKLDDGSLIAVPTARF